MTREEALQHFKEQLDIFGGEHAEAIKVAIEALKRVSFENDTEIKSCSKDSDLISRAEVIEALRYAQHRFTVADEAGGMGSVKWSENVIYFAAAERVLTELPSAGRPKGEWVSKEELIDAINDAEFVYDGDDDGHKEHDISELVRVMFKDIIDNLPSADMRGDTE